MFPAKKTSPHLRLEIEIQPNGYRGSVPVLYDSSDPRSFAERNQWGVWKPSSCELAGQTNWTTVFLEWADARLDGNCNGYDFRVQLPGDSRVVLGAIRVVPLPPVTASGKGDDAILRNSEMEIRFSNVGISRVASPKLGTTIVENGNGPLFRLLLKPPGNAAASWVASTEAKLGQRQLQGSTCIQSFRFINGISVTCSTLLQGGDSRWAVAIVNESGLEVAAAQYPILKGVRMGDSHRDDTLIIPAV